MIPRTGSIASNVGQDTPAAEDLRLRPRDDGGEDFFRLLHSACARLAAGLVADAGCQHDDTVRDEPRDVALIRRVRPHLTVHRRRNEERAIARKRQRRQQVVGMSVRNLGQEIGGGGRNDDRVRAAREIDVAHAVRRAGGPQIREHGIAGECLQGYRRDESARARRHDNVDRDIRFDEQASELRRLVCGDASSHTQYDAGERLWRTHHPCGRYDP